MSSSDQLESLVARCRHLLLELDEFDKYQTVKLASEKRTGVGTKHVRNIVSRELTRLEKLLSSDTPSELRDAGMNSSNLSFFEAVWSMAKQCRGLRRISFHDPPEIVANEGALWIKLSSVSERRLVMSFANEGWQSSGDTDEDDESEHIEQGDSDDACFSDAESRALLQTAQNLASSAKGTLIGYQHPKVHWIFTRLQEGRVAQIDALLESIRGVGITVSCGDAMASIPIIETTFEGMLEAAMPRLSDTLNVDCTILLALVSDISHGSVVEQPWFNVAIRRQIEEEAREPLLSSSLYPIIDGRDLICTTEAAARMHAIVDEIGTSTERQRTDIMFGTSRSMKSGVELIAEMQQYSTHEVSLKWKLPVMVAGTSYPPDKLPPTGKKLATGELPAADVHRKSSESGLSPLNRSVFLHGWANNLTTITSNRTVAKQIETLVKEDRADEDVVGPDIWISTTTRSLLAKEKNRAAH